MCATGISFRAERQRYLSMSLIWSASKRCHAHGRCPSGSASICCGRCCVGRPSGQPAPVRLDHAGASKSISLCSAGLVCLVLVGLSTLQLPSGHSGGGGGVQASTNSCSSHGGGGFFVGRSIRWHNHRLVMATPGLICAADLTTAMAMLPPQPPFG